MSPQHQLPLLPPWLLLYSKRQKGTPVSALPVVVEEGPLQSIHPHYFLQGHHRENISLWFENCSAAERKALWRVVRLAGWIIGTTLRSWPTEDACLKLKASSKTPVTVCSPFSPLPRGTTVYRPGLTNKLIPLILKLDLSDFYIYFLIEFILWCF